LGHLALAQAFRELHDADRSVGAGDGETATRKLEVGLAHFQKMRRRLLALLDDERGRLDDRLSGRGDRARAARAAAESHELAVVLLQLDLVEGDAELVAQHLCKRRGMALAV